MFWKICKTSFDQIIRIITLVLSFCWLYNLKKYQLKENDYYDYYDYYYIEKLSKVSNEMFMKKDKYFFTNSFFVSFYVIQNVSLPYTRVTELEQIFELQFFSWFNVSFKVCLLLIHKLLFF